jgi:hypothetical protein
MNKVTGVSATDAPGTVITSSTFQTLCGAATSGTSVAYNVYDPNSRHDAYSWGGTTYSSVAAFAAVSGQGSHDTVADPEIAWGGGYPSDGSPEINSADANAPGELATDIQGIAPVADPSVPLTGTGVGYYTRGAYEYTQFGGTSLHLSSEGL